MPITHVTSIAELLAKSNEALLRAHDLGLASWLAVPSHAWAQQRKLQLIDVFPIGVDVLTHRQLIEQLWEIYGDGSRIISAQERKVLLRPLVEQVGLLESSPSPGLMDQLGSFIEEAIAPGDAHSAGVGFHPARSAGNGLSVGAGFHAARAGNFSESESRLLELVSLYERKLELEGYVEIAQAEAALVQLGACVGKSFVFESPDLHSAHIRRFIMGIEHNAHVAVIEQRLVIGLEDSSAADELSSLRSRLFTGQGGVVPQGKVHVGISHGAHVASDVIVDLVRVLHDQNGIDYRDMVVLADNAASAYPRLHEALAHAGIPFETQFSLPCVRTGLGAAFLSVERVVAQADEDSAFEALVDLACSPYSGIAGADARALQMRWRERAHSTSAARMKDIQEGFAQGNATQAMMQERLMPLASLLDAPRDLRVRMLFDNAHAAHLDASALIDDRETAEALLDYLEMCERFSCAPSADEMANLSVTLSRSFGDASAALAITEPNKLGLARAGAIVMCDLDASRYPMAAQAKPLDGLMAKLGMERADTLAHDQRIMLLNVIEACKDAFAFSRSTHDPAGDESCQSALFEELVSVYRTQVDEDADLPIQDVPAALLPWCIIKSEADVFLEGSTSQITTITRGVLSAEGSIDNLIYDLKGNPLPFSPTALEDYYRCPYRWFACRRVGYNGMDTSFDPATQGNLVHAVMERFYADLAAEGVHRVTPDALSQALDIASASFDRQVELEKARERRGLYLRTRFDECACEALRKQVFDIVRRDAEFLPGFEPRYFELSLGHKSEHQLEYAGVPVRGKVDRIDVDKEGNAIIVDYKLSSLAPSAGYGLARDLEVPLRIQTDIYATLVQRHFAALGEPIRVVGSVYRSYSKNVLRGAYAAGINWGDVENVREDLDALPNENHPESYDEYLSRIEQEVRSCMERLQSGFIEPDPIADGVCEYCRAASFCPRGGA